MRGLDERRGKGSAKECTRMSHRHRQQRGVLGKGEWDMATSVIVPTIKIQEKKKIMFPSWEMPNL